jgi:hypothetical protein
MYNRPNGQTSMAAVQGPNRLETKIPRDSGPPQTVSQHAARVQAYAKQVANRKQTLLLCSPPASCWALT